MMFGVLVSVLLLSTEVRVVVGEDTMVMTIKGEGGSEEAQDGAAETNATTTRSDKEDSFADMIDRALEEFTENEQSEGSVC
ncbi:hypothetical protein MLD38_005812 [Melastoma candidum]|uniref:Uncharacterized protein n=1 Tax=Melastoma candidum TaxID=119954 RepID=A0ACB9RKC1_9MYRT|nr:hypothetical protein MLD38_005812 [Melastoma candidum]